MWCPAWLGTWWPSRGVSCLRDMLCTLPLGLDHRGETEAWRDSGVNVTAQGSIPALLSPAAIPVGLGSPPGAWGCPMGSGRFSVGAISTPLPPNPVFGDGLGAPNPAAMAGGGGAGDTQKTTQPGPPPGGWGGRSQPKAGGWGGGAIGLVWGGRMGCGEGNVCQRQQLPQQRWGTGWVQGDSRAMGCDRSRSLPHSVWSSRASVSPTADGATGVGDVVGDGVGIPSCFPGGGMGG